jgi:uncharacterized protein (TIGR03437 family)
LALSAGAILRASDGKPTYSAASIVNSAAGAPGLLAPNTLATIYGTDLSWAEHALGDSDIQAGELPIMFAGAGVQVLVGNVPAHLLYASDKQINFLVPSILAPGPVDLVVVRDSQLGPIVRVTIEAAGPGLFLMPATAPPAAIVVRLDSSLATTDDPLKPGDEAILFATGLGATSPRAAYGRLATGVCWLRNIDQFDVTLDGARVERANIEYVGLAPGFAGLYQINLKIPDWAAANPEIRLSAAGLQSPPGIHIPIRRDE